MVLSRRLLTSMFASMIALLAALAVSGSPAAADPASHGVGTRTELSRCSYSPWFQCLYYRGDGSGAYWGMGTQRNLNGVFDHDLADNYFFSGTGSGAGAKVRNAAASMDCDTQVIFTCWSFVFPNEKGNYDYASAGTGGTLFFTWNAGASAEYI